MAFNKQNNQTQNTIENQSESGIGNIISNLAPIVLLALEQFTGKPIPQLKGTLADITAYLQILDNKIDNLERNCAEQFQLQEKQLSSLQQVSELISNEKTKTIRFGNNKQITQIDE